MEKYKLYGVELSPYSMKVRSYLKFKKVDFDWVVADFFGLREIKKKTGLALMPMVLGPDGEIYQDSTPIIRKLDEI